MKQKTMAELLQDVERAQNGCNLSGILQSAAAAIKDLREILPAADTGVINRHPIMRAWASKIADLSGNPDGAYPLAELNEIRALGYSPTYRDMMRPPVREEVAGD